MLVHFSSDQLLVHSGGEKLLLPFEDIERQFPIQFVKFYNTQKKDNKDNDIVVINGPGSYTQLRVGCVTLNMLSAMRGGDISFIDIPKIHLYAQAVQQGLLPQIGVIFMGQKKKARVVEFRNPKSEIRASESDFIYEFVATENVLERLEGKEHFLDWAHSHPVFDILDPEKMIGDFRLDGDEICFEYLGEKICISLDHFLTVEKLEPRYLMEAV